MTYFERAICTCGVDAAFERAYPDTRMRPSFGPRHEHGCQLMIASWQPVIEREFYANNLREWNKVTE